MNSLSSIQLGWKITGPGWHACALERNMGELRMMTARAYVVTWQMARNILQHVYNAHMLPALAEEKGPVSAIGKLSRFVAGEVDVSI